MAMPKKGSRAITVDGVDYRWRVSRRTTDPPSPAVVVIELTSAGGSLAAVELPYLKFNPWLYLGDPGPRPSPMLETVSPADVESYIRLALQAGWNSVVPGGAFNLKISEQESRPSRQG